MNTFWNSASELSQTALNWSNVIMVCGIQWWDEGKWKAVSAFQWKKIEYVVWANGGWNAWHTVFYSGKKLDFHELPGGSIIDGAKIYLSKGRVIQISTLGQEMEKLKNVGISLQNKIIIWGWAQVVLKSFQQKIDADIERLRWGNAVGTTMKWIGPSYAWEALRLGLTIKELLTFNDSQIKQRVETICWLFCSLDKNSLKDEISEEKQKLQKWISEWNIEIDMDDMLIHKAAKDGKNILVEQSQSFLLGKEAGAYPFCTSSDTSINGMKSYLNLPHNLIPFVIGTAKAIMSKVGGWLLPTKMWQEEIYKEFEKKFARQTWEVWVTTWRLRDLWWVDIPALERTISINPLNSILITKGDVLRQLAAAQRESFLKPEMRFYTTPENYDSISLSDDTIKNIEGFGATIRRLLPDFKWPLYFWTGPQEHEIMKFS
jgi:adenylosuccinate synthase